MRLLAFVLAVISTLASFGINRADSVKVFFRAGHRQFDPSLGNNRMVMDSFINIIREGINCNDIEGINVYAYASPDGSSRANELLAVNRCQEISDYIVDKSGVSTSLIRQFPSGIAWEGLRNLVASHPDVPSREAVLDILDNTPVWIFDTNGKIVDGRKSRLMSLARGVPYRWMQTHLFPQLRNAVAISVVRKETISPSGEDKEIEIAVEEPSTQTKEVTLPSEQDKMTDTEEIADNSESSSKKDYTYKSHHFALKTNLLFDAALTPNLEFEWLINKNWSVSLEGYCAWWKPEFNRVYRIALVSPEARYHIRPRAPWHGLYVGLFAGGGLYQLENRHDGYRGEGGMGGLSFGYMWHAGKHFFFEAGIGAGYMHTRYKVYKSMDGHKLYMSTKSLNYFGPLKLKFSIGWRFDIKNKIKKVNSTL